MNVAWGILIASAPIAAFILLLLLLRVSRRTPPRVHWIAALFAYGGIAAMDGFIAWGRVSKAIAGNWTDWVGAFYPIVIALYFGFLFFKQLLAGPAAASGAEPQP